jgi:hypothetical protein
MPLAVAAPPCESPCRHHAALCRLDPPPRVAPRRHHLAMPPLAGIGRAAPCCCRQRLAVPPAVVVTSHPPTPIARLRPGRVDHHVQPHVAAADGVIGMHVIVVAVAAALRSVTANIGSPLELALCWFLQEFVKQICWAFWWFRKKTTQS